MQLCALDTWRYAILLPLVAAGCAGRTPSARPSRPAATAATTPRAETNEEPRCAAPGSRTFALDNGIEVALRQTAKQRATVRLVLPVGAVHGPYQAAHVVEHLVADVISGDDAPLTLASIHGLSYAHTTLFETAYEVSGPPRHISQLLWLLRRAFEPRSFSDEAIEAARSVVAQELRERAQNAIAFAAWATTAIARGSEPGVFDPLDLSAVTPNAVRTFYEEAITLSAARLEIESPYPPDVLEPYIEAMFGDRTWPAPRRGDPRRVPPGAYRMCARGLGEHALVVAVPRLPDGISEERLDLMARAFDLRIDEVRNALDERGIELREAAASHADVDWSPVPFRVVARTGDASWETLEVLAVDLLEVAWNVPPEHATKIAFQRWFERAITIRCGPPPPRPQPDAIAPPTSPTPSLHTLILVRDASACFRSS